MVLMVAEKPSMAESIARLLSDGRCGKRVSRGLPVFEFTGAFLGRPGAAFRVTSVTGHVFGCDFAPQFQSWDKVNEADLFDAETVKKESSGGGKVCAMLPAESHDCTDLVLWLDCDREGENICFEVISLVKRNIPWDRTWRAKFSAVTKQEMTKAMASLVKPNKDVSDAVECRQELDLKVGCAFTRYQTKFFQGKYGDLDASVVSYGPCQTPTLGFCVQRHDEIVNFKPESFFRIVPVVQKSGGNVAFEWNRGRIFDEPVARLIHSRVAATKAARVVQVSRTTETKPRPAALNTVEMLKVASRSLNIGPHAAMSIAEQLYLSGYISYPRTESTAYPASFDLDGVLHELRGAGGGAYSGFVQSILSGARARPKGGVDVGDHPPITPMQSASMSELYGDSWKIYDYVVRHFLATLSPDCKYQRTKVTIDLNGESFSATGKVVEDPGWTLVLPGSTMKDEKTLEGVAAGDTVHCSDVRLQPGQTSSPDYLTEADLIGLMEKHGIGTDASIPTHIQNICVRNYVSIVAGRKVEPTKLGIILVHGYHKIDPELVLPLVRSRVEEYVTLIAEGKARLGDVLRYALELFAEKFAHFTRHIVNLDSLMEASYSPLSKTGDYLTRCGVCSRYMRHLSARPQRLYCQTCQATYNLPQGGAIKTYFNFQCPLDNFELVVSHVEGGKSTVLCPRCYNDPPALEELAAGVASKLLPPPAAKPSSELTKSVSATAQPAAAAPAPARDSGMLVMSCADCTHPTCRESLTTNYVCDCVDEHCTGAMAFVTRSTGKWKICCNTCTAMLLLPPEAAKVRVVDEECDDCGARLMSLVFPPGKSPLPGRPEAIKGCCFCDGPLASGVQQVRGRFANSRGRGGRGRGRGRGGGRGQGRDRRDPGRGQGRDRRDPGR